MRKLTILVLAALFVAATCLPVMAQDKAEWGFYGSIRMWTGWETESLATVQHALTGGQRTAAWSSNTLPNDDEDLVWAQQNNSRIGARVKWGAVGGQFEYGHGGAAIGAEGSGTSADTTFVRLLYATWNFGPGILTIGQDYTPYFFVISDMCGPSGGDCSGIGWGSAYGGRQDQIKLTFGGFKIALLEPRTTLPSTTPGQQTIVAGAAVVAANDTDRTWPKIEASYSGSFGPIGFFVGGGYNKMTGQWAMNSGIRELDVDSWVMAAGLKAAFGPFYVNGALQLAQNIGNYGAASTINGNTAALSTAAMSMATGVVDADYWCGMIVAGFKVSDMLRFEAGFSHQEAEQDDIAANAGRTFEYETQAYFLMAIISPAKNVYIIPEIGKAEYNHRKYASFADIVLGDMTWAGIKWQIDF